MQDRKVTQTCAYRPRLRGGCLKPETVSNFSNFCMRLLQYITIYYTPLAKDTVMQCYAAYIYIRRPWPSPRPGRRLGPPEVWILSFLNPCHAQRCRQKPPQGHSNGSRAPHGRSNGFFYRRSRLPAVPALQPAVCVHSALSLGRPCLGHARRQKPPQGHSNGSRHPPGRSNGFL